MSDEQHWASNQLARRMGWTADGKDNGNGIRLVNSKRRFTLVSIILMLITISTPTLAVFATPIQQLSHTQFMTGRAATNSSLLECLQVTPPVLSSAGSCQQTLMVHTFAASYGQPFVGK